VTGCGGQLPPLEMTVGQWRNRRKRVRDSHGAWITEWSKVLMHTGPLTQFRYGSVTFAGQSAGPGKDTGPLQWCTFDTPESGTVTIDVDHEAAFMGTRTARYITRADAISTRTEPSGAVRFHVKVDARAVPPDQRPPQRPIAGGDVMSNGWTPVPGSWHWSGVRYEPVIHPGNRVTVVTATPELMAAIVADQADYAAASGGGDGTGSSAAGHGMGGGAPLPPDAELLQRGLDHPHDDNLTRLAWRLAAEGRSWEQAYPVLRQVADITAETGPWADADLERKFTSARARGAGEVSPEAAAWAQGTAGVSAGQETMSTPAQQEVLTSAPDQEFRYIRTMAQARAKYYAEFHHCEAPGCQQGQLAAPHRGRYKAVLMTGMRLGRSPLTIGDVLGPCTHWGNRLDLRASCQVCAQARADLGKSLDEMENHHLIRRQGPYIHLLRDAMPPKIRVHCPGCAGEHSANEYPGAPLGVRCPRTGGNWAAGQLAGLLAYMFGAVPDLTRREQLLIINDGRFRAAFGIAHLSYVSMVMATRARRELREREQLEQVAKPVLCRKAHRWVTVERAVYRIRGQFDPAWITAVQEHAQRILHPDEGRMRHRMAYAVDKLRLPVHDFGRLWAMADHWAPEYAEAA
jgi:hypothetical protein